jgi:hypothetical protein
MTLSEIHSKAWVHFDMIAKQRVSNFNHYFIAIGVLLTASAAFGKDAHHKNALLIFSAFNIVAPVCFWFIDIRINRLLNNLKGTLRTIEDHIDWPDVFRPFHQDADEQTGWWHRATSYSGVFWSLFALHIVHTTRTGITGTASSQRGLPEARTSKRLTLPPPPPPKQKSGTIEDNEQDETQQPSPAAVFSGLPVF